MVLYGLLGESVECMEGVEKKFVDSEQDWSQKQLVGVVYGGFNKWVYGVFLS